MVCPERMAEVIPALEIHRGERISLVGGGGKTGLGFRLMAEARARGWTALFTTTTKILACQAGEAPFVVTEVDGASPAVLRERLCRDGRLVLVRRWLDEWDDTPGDRRQKVGGFPPEEVDRWGEVLAPDLLVVEADGSRHRPFKAPALYEPVVPSGTTLFVAMAGLSVLGRPLDARWVHRHERVAELANVSAGVLVEPELVATILAHPQGGRRGAPSGARRAVVLAQVGADALAQGREVARRLLIGGAFPRIVLADLDDPAAGIEAWLRPGREGGGVAAGSRVHAVVLAAGAGRRMGQNKLLLPLGDKALLAHAVDAALGCRAERVWVVLGAEAAAVRQALGTRPVGFLYSHGWEEGQAAAVRAAVKALGRQTDAMLFLAGDAPFVPAAHLDRLIERFEVGGATIVWSGNASDRGIPALFGRGTFPALSDLRGDVGGRALLGAFKEEAVVAASPSAVFTDIDTLQTYRQAGRWLESQNT